MYTKVKRCTTCKILKPINEFRKYKSSNSKKYYHSNCILCNIARGLNWYQSDKGKKYLKTIQRKRLLKRYNLTEVAFNKMVENQNGVCAICNKPPKRLLCVDHNHNTGDIRGLLCHNCNIHLDWAIKHKKDVAHYSKS